MNARKLLALFPLLVLAPAEAPRLAPAADAAVTKALTMSASLAMESARVNAMGEEDEMPADEMVEFALEIESNVVDRYGKSVDGRLAELTRTFGKTTMGYETSEGGSADSGELDGAGVLEDESVRFVRGEDGWTKSFVVAEGESAPDEDLLEGLAWDMDFTALLPDESVADGDTWTAVDPGLRHVFVPGGLPTSSAPAGLVAGLLFDDLVPAISGSLADFGIDCTWHDAGEGRGEIEFKFSGSCSFESAEVVIALFSIVEGDDEDAPDDLDSQVSTEFEGVGKLTWNLAEGRAEAFEMKVDADVTIELDFSQTWGEDTMDISVDAEFLGAFEWALTTSSAE